MVAALVILAGASAVYLYAKGESSGRKSQLNQHHKQKEKAENEQAKNDQEYEHSRRNLSRRKRLLDLVKKARDD